MLIKIDPIAKPRMTRADKWNKRECVLRYRAFCDELRLKHRGAFPDAVVMNFTLPMPASWSEKKKTTYAGRDHTCKPDIDNLIKAVMDALLLDDAAVWAVCAFKYWGREGSIEIKPMYPDGQ